MVAAGNQTQSGQQVVQSLHGGLWEANSIIGHHEPIHWVWQVLSQFSLWTGWESRGDFLACARTSWCMALYITNMCFFLSRTCHMCQWHHCSVLIQHLLTLHGWGHGWCGIHKCTFWSYIWWMYSIDNFFHHYYKDELCTLPSFLSRKKFIQQWTCSYQIGKMM